MDFLDKSLKLTEAQYNAALFAHKVIGKLLTQASPTDDTHYEVTFGEVAQLAGEELMGKLGK